MMTNTHQDSDRQDGSQGIPNAGLQNPSGPHMPIADGTSLKPSTPSPPPQSVNSHKLPDASSVVVVEPKEDPLPPPRRLSAREKLGLLALILFPLGSVIILVGLGILWFLWLGSVYGGAIWHEVTARDWLSKATNIIAEAVKTIVSFQVGTEVAMIASIAMERFTVLLPHAASLSMMKAGASSGSVLTLLKHQFRAMTATKSKRRTTVLTFVLAATLTAVFAVAQVISILLISDTAVRVVHGLPEAVNVTIGSSVPGGLADELTRQVTEDSPWLRGPARYPAFAEYSEPPYVADGVLDTGVTLRAFLPFPDPERRQLVQAYNGTATVVDVRVTCQRPKFVNLSVTASRPGYLDLEGFIWSTVTTPRMVSVYEGTQYSAPFTNTNTPAAHKFKAVAPMQSRTDDLWGLSMTSVTTGGDHMVSEFRDLGNSGSDFGSGYLVLNVSRGSMHDWSFGFPYNDTAARLNPLLSNRSEWLDMIFYNNYSYPLTLSATLCFTPWGQATLPVEITSNHNANRTESAPGFDLTTMSYDYTFLRRMYGQRQGDKPPLTIEERGILSLQNRSTWTQADDSTSASLSSASGFSDSMMLGGTFSYVDLTQSKSLTEQLHPFDGMFFPVNNYKALAQQVVMNNQGGGANGDGIAFMIQSLITLQSSMTYYDVLRAYNVQRPVDVAYFVQATVAVSAVGITVVSVALAVHFLLMCVVLVLFLRQTKHSRLGATWAVMASMQQPAPPQGSTSPAGGEKDEDSELLGRWLHGSADSTAVGYFEDDDQVASRMEKLGMARRRVGTRVVGERIEVAFSKEE